MHNVWILIQREYLERVRSKSFMIFTLLMPALMAGSVIIPAKLAEMKSGGARRIVIVAGNPEIAIAVEQQLLETESTPGATSQADQQTTESYAVGISTTPTEAERNDLLQQVTDGKIDGFLWLTDEAVAQHKVTYLTRDAADFRGNRELRSAVTAALAKHRLAEKGMSGPEVEALLTPITLDAVHIEKGKEGVSGAAIFATAVAMVMLLYLVVLIYGVAVMRSVIEEKSSRIMEVLLSSVTAKELLAGKILGVGAVGLTQILIWITFAVAFAVSGMMAAKSFVSEIHIPTAGVIFFGVFFVLGYFLYSAMYAAIGSMVTTDQEAQQMQWPAMVPIILAVFLMNPVIQQPNSQLAFWLSIIPFFAPLLMLVRVLVEEPPVWQLALCLGLMLATIYGLLSLASRIYRVGILMYGKRPTLPELRRWLRYTG